MKIKWIGLQKLINSFKRSRQRLYERRLKNVAQRVKGHVVDEVPVDTGRLARTIALVHRSGMKYEVHEREPYGRFVREGTRRHPIYPIRKKALYWPGAAHPVAWVWHPGTKRNPYHERGVAHYFRNRSISERLFSDAIAVDLVS